MILSRKAKVEETRARTSNKTSYDMQNIKNKLGLSQSETDSRVILELHRLKGKSDATWKALKLDKNETLSRYNIK